MDSHRGLNVILLFLLLLSPFLGVVTKEVKAYHEPYTPIKWALVEIDTANNGLDNTTNTRYTQDLANIIRSFGFPFDIYRHQDLTSTALQFPNGTIRYQVLILERPDSSTQSEPSVDQKNWIKWALGNGTNILFIKRSIEYFADVFEGVITSMSATSVTFNFTRDYAGYSAKTTGTISPTENVFLTLSSFAVDATRVMEGNYSTTFGAFLLKRTYSQGEAWFLAERAKDHDALGVMPNDATRTALYYTLLYELPKVPVYILPWQRYGSAHAFRIDGGLSPVMINSTVVPGNFRKFFDVLVDQVKALADFGYPATLSAIAWGGTPPGSVQRVSLTSIEPEAYSNIPSVSGYRLFGNLSRGGNTTGYKVVLYNSTVGGKYDTVKVDTDGDKDWGDEAALKPGQNFTWYCEYCDYQTTAFLSHMGFTWPMEPYTIYFWTYIPITHQHDDKAASWAQIKNYVINLVDNYGWDIGLLGTDHAWRWFHDQWQFSNGTQWPVNYAQTRIQWALDLLEEEFGTRVKKTMSHPHGGRTPQVQQALVNLGFISEGSPYGPYLPTYHSPLYVSASAPSNIPVVPARNKEHAMLAWKYRGLSVSFCNPYRLGLSDLRGKVSFLSNSFQTNGDPYNFVYNKTSMWVTTPYKASTFYHYSMQMLRNVKTAYWTGDRVVIEFPASSNLENFVWRFPIQYTGKYFNDFSDNRTTGKIVKVDRESVFVEFNQGRGSHKIEVIYGTSPKYYFLDIATTPGGTTDPSPGTYGYLAETVVNITAYPSLHYALDYWLLNGLGGGNLHTLSLTMDRDFTVEAVFTPQPYVFDPSKFYTVREAEGSGRNYWVGAPAVFFDNETEVFWLVYRWRKPLPVRGHTLSIANSTDGIHFTDIWSASKDEFPVPGVSLSRASILKDPKTDMFKLYVCKGAPWRIYKLEDVKDPADFDPTTARLVLSVGETGEWDDRAVGTPWVAWVRDRYVMLYVGHHDIDHLGLATSFDGESWTKHPDNPVLSGGLGVWDSQIRSGSIMFLPEYWAVYYDGFGGGYFEKDTKTGLAVWNPPPPPYGKLEKITVDKPVIEGIDPHWTGLRCVAPVVAQGKTFFYYETGTSDGSMDLRVSVVERARINKSFSSTSANRGDIVGVTIKLYMDLPYASVTIVDKLPGELTYWGGFTDSLVPDATPTIDNNTITYTVNKTGEHIITYNVNVTKAYARNEIMTNTANATYQATYYPDALLTASADLTILHLTPPELIQELIETIEMWNMPKGTESSLTRKLEDALHLLDMSNENGAIHKLMDFIDQVKAQRDKGKLTTQQADQLIAEAQRIIDLING